MAVNLPSDLVADVMRNAAPERRNGAVARLRSIGEGNTTFAATVDQTGTAKAVNPDYGKSTHIASGPADRNRKEADERNAGLRGFERMVLRNLFETLLPAEESGAFGGGPSAGVWRSMAADHLAGTLADDGGIGIARILASTASAPAPRRDLEWPYFSLQPLLAPGGEVQS